MKSVLITFDQAHYDRIIAVLDRLNCRGYTYWDVVQGRGSDTGVPHLGSHSWPSLSSAILTVVPEARVDSLLKVLKNIDEAYDQLGLRAFVWNIEQSI